MIMLSRSTVANSIFFPNISWVFIPISMILRETLCFGLFFIIREVYKMKKEKKKCGKLIMKILSSISTMF